MHVDFITYIIKETHNVEIYLSSFYKTLIFVLKFTTYIFVQKPYFLYEYYLISNKSALYIHVYIYILIWVYN